MGLWTESLFVRLGTVRLQWLALGEVVSSFLDWVASCLLHFLKLFLTAHLPLSRSPCSLLGCSPFPFFPPNVAYSGCVCGRVKHFYWSTNLGMNKKRARTSRFSAAASKPEMQTWQRSPVDKGFVQYLMLYIWQAVFLTLLEVTGRESCDRSVMALTGAAHRKEEHWLAIGIKCVSRLPSQLQ